MNSDVKIVNYLDDLTMIALSHSDILTAVLYKLTNDFNNVCYG